MAFDTFSISGANAWASSRFRVAAALAGVDYLDNRRATVTRGQDGAIRLAVL